MSIKRDGNWYSVALTYKRNNDILLRLIEVYTNNEHSALGEAIYKLEEIKLGEQYNVVGASLVTHAVLLQKTNKL